MKTRLLAHRGRAHLLSMTTKKSKQLPATWTLRPTPELEKAVEEALEVTGITARQQLIFDVLQQGLRDYVRKVIAERRKAEERFLQE
jgi:ABC-type uncharacterized transport system ATPase subunit